MKTVGIFEAKTKLSDLCDEVARIGMSVLITRRGLALVRIDPIQEQRLSVKERLAQYKVKQGTTEAFDPVEFVPPARSREESSFRIEE
jgi:prevent-host-death family protein